MGTEERSIYSVITEDARRTASEMVRGFVRDAAAIQLTTRRSRTMLIRPGTSTAVRV